MLGSATAGYRWRGAPALDDFKSGSIGGNDFGEFGSGSIGGSDFGHLDLGHLDLGGPSPSSGDTAADEQGIGITEITCLPPERGVECMARCAQYGINCAGARQHPYKSGFGLGLLGKGVSAVEITTECWYYYPGGDMCIFRPPRAPICRYTICKP
jgi:hypothetical protein